LLAVSLPLRPLTPFVSLAALAQIATIRMSVGRGVVFRPGGVRANAATISAAFAGLNPTRNAQP
jgi:hypothetical protein